MKTLLSDTYSKASGRLGNIVLSRNAVGELARPFRYPRQPSDPKYILQKQIFSRCVLSWRALAPATKSAWAAAGQSYTWLDRFKNPYHPSGWQLYLFSNMKNISVDLPINDFEHPYIPTLGMTFDTLEISAIANLVSIDGLHAPHERYRGVLYMSKQTHERADPSQLEYIKLGHFGVAAPQPLIFSNISQIVTHYPLNAGMRFYFCLDSLDEDTHIWVVNQYYLVVSGI